MPVEQPDDAVASIRRAVADGDEFIHAGLYSLTVACGSVVISTWIDKGFGLVIGGFIPNPFERVFEYWPTTPEILISVGVWATGFFILSVLYKIVVSVKEEVSA